MFTLTPDMLSQRKIGLERETLRVDQSAARLATTPHPTVLGSSLTHPNITVDYAEQMLEFVTTPHPTTMGAYRELWQTTAWVQQQLDSMDEMLWSYSMPPILPNPEQIEPANFGSSGLGQFKRLYRVGLSYRYGREMQLISGMHFNYSLPKSVIQEIAEAHGYYRDCPKTAANDVYLGAIRNITRYGWLVSYLFGASPKVDDSFIRAVQTANQFDITDQQEYDQATSLRMSDIGYTNKRRCRWQAELNGFDKFLDSIAVGLAERCTIFSDIGVTKECGERKQLNDRVLQIENEFYSIARPKAVSVDGETPLVALANHGIEYIELRMTDLDPTATIGMTPESLAFLEVFTLYCLTKPSPRLSVDDLERCEKNRVRMANGGRCGEVQLLTEAGECSAKTCAMQLLTEMKPIASVVDEANAATGDGHNDNNDIETATVIDQLVAAIANDERLSQRIYRETNEHFAGDINAYAQQQAETHRETLRGIALSDDYLAAQVAKAEQSLRQAAEIAEQSEGFEVYYQQYRAQLQTLFADRNIPILN